MKSVVLHPILFAIYPVLFLYSFNIYNVPLRGLFLPLLVVPLFALALWLVLRFVLKSGIKAGFIVSLIIILVTFYGHIFNLITDSLVEKSEITQILLVGLFLVLLGVGAYYFARTKRNLEKPTMVVNVIAISMIAIVLVNIGTSKIESYSMEEINPIIQKFEPDSINTQTLPDIYYILLDAYANHLVLKEFLAYDNQEFITALTERGFVVPQGFTHSNYEFTEFSITSILGMDYVNNLVPKGGTESELRQDHYRIIKNNSVMYNLKSIGYTVISFDSGAIGTRNIDIANENLCLSPLTDVRFLNKGKGTTILPAIKIIDEKFQEMIDEQKRQQILCEFSELPKIRDRVEGPIFVFTHVLAPHAPYVFDSNGQPIISDHYKFDNEFVDKQEISEKRIQAYIGQLEFANKKTIEAIDEILAKTDKPTIIIIQSDHGKRDTDVRNTDEENLAVTLGNFNAFYVPDDMKDSFREPITPVNTFRKLFNSVFGTAYEILDDGVFIEGNEVKNWKETKDTIIDQL